MGFIASECNRWKWAWRHRRARVLYPTIGAAVLGALRAAYPAIMGTASPDWQAIAVQGVLFAVVVNVGMVAVAIKFLRSGPIAAYPAGGPRIGRATSDFKDTLRSAMNKLAVTALAGLVLTAGVVYTASKSDGDVVREVRDRMEVEDLLWRYARALDTSDAEAYASVYTPDGQFGTGANATRGRDALRKMIADGRQRQVEAQAKGEPKRPPMYHMTANQRVQFTDKDHARVEAYYITAIAAGGNTAPLRVAGDGRSIDDLLRLNGQWLINTRNVSPQD